MVETNLSCHTQPSLRQAPEVLIHWLNLWQAQAQSQAPLPPLVWQALPVKLVEVGVQSQMICSPPQSRSQSRRWPHCLSSLWRRMSLRSLLSRPLSTLYCRPPLQAIVTVLLSELSLRNSGTDWMVQLHK